MFIALVRNSETSYIQDLWRKQPKETLSFYGMMPCQVGMNTLVCIDRAKEERTCIYQLPFVICCIEL